MNNDSVEEAKYVLLHFMEEMNAWEIKYYKLYSDDTLKYMDAAVDDLRKIYAKWLTIKERKTGRSAGPGPSVGIPPEYDPNTEIVESTEESGKNKLLFYTQQTTGFKTKLRYTLIFTKNEWRIDKKEGYDHYKEKWVNRVF